MILKNQLFFNNQQMSKVFKRMTSVSSSNAMFFFFWALPRMRRKKGSSCNINHKNCWRRSEPSDGIDENFSIIPSIYLLREVFKPFCNNKTSLVEFAAGALYDFWYNIVVKFEICIRTEQMPRDQD